MGTTTHRDQNRDGVAARQHLPGRPATRWTPRRAGVRPVRPDHHRGPQGRCPGRNSGPHHIGRHAHPTARPETPPAPPPATGIDYARLLLVTHPAELAQEVKLRRASHPPQTPTRRARDQATLVLDADGQVRPYRDRWQGFFGFIHRPFGRDLATGILHGHAPAVARPWPASAGAWPNAASGCSPERSASGNRGRARDVLHTGCDRPQHHLPAHPTVGIRGNHHQIVLPLGGPPLTHHATLVPQTADALATEQV